MRIAFKKVLFSLTCTGLYLYGHPQEPKLMGKWAENGKKRILFDSAYVFEKTEHPETIIFKANHRYKIIFYAYALEDSFQLNPHRTVARGYYRVDKDQITFTRKGMSVTAVYSLKNDTVEITKSLGEFLGIPTTVTSYRRIQ